MGLFHSPPHPHPTSTHNWSKPTLSLRGHQDRVRTNWGSWDICRDMMGWSRISAYSMQARWRKGKLTELENTQLTQLPRSGSQATRKYPASYIPVSWSIKTQQGKGTDRPWTDAWPASTHTDSLLTSSTAPGSQPASPPPPASQGPSHCGLLCLLAPLLTSIDGANGAPCTPHGHQGCHHTHGGPQGLPRCRTAADGLAASLSTNTCFRLLRSVLVTRVPARAPEPISGPPRGLPREAAGSRAHRCMMEPSTGAAG